MLELECGDQGVEGLEKGKGPNVAIESFRSKVWAFEVIDTSTRTRISVLDLGEPPQWPHYIEYWISK
jgi:hypothetical protein